MTTKAITEEKRAEINVSYLLKELVDIQDLLNGRGGTQEALNHVTSLIEQVNAVTKRPLRRVQIGSAAVDSGMLMIVDPCYVLKQSPEMAEVAKEIGLTKASDSFNTNMEVASDLCYHGAECLVITKKTKDENGKVVADEVEIFNPLHEITPEQHRQIAYGAVCSTGIGDGTFPVYAIHEGKELVGMEVRFDE